jgi:hypothetical protein
MREREIYIRRKLPFQEREEEEVQESCGKAWHGLEELRGYTYIHTAYCCSL